MKRRAGRLEAESHDLALGVAPLNDEERAWIARLERVFKAQPSRLLLIEIGDGIEVVDRAAAQDVSLEDGNAVRNGVWLANVQHSGPKLTGVSG